MTASASEATQPELASSVRVGPLALAGMASLGAGLIHAAAMGVHSEHQQAARAFAVLALAQMAWGAWALVATRVRAVAISGVLLAGAAIVGWVMAKTSGIGFIDGLGTVEDIQLPDALAAALAAVAGLMSLRLLLTRDERAATPSTSTLGIGALVFATAALGGLNATGSHSHEGGHPAGEHAAVADDHGHGDGGEGGDEGHDQEGAHDDPGAHGDDEGHAGPAVPPNAFDPTKPINLSGVDGVSPEQQARAELLVENTIARLPQFADVEQLEERGFHSIGDGFTGHEHFLNWDYINDDHILNPDYPESLVFEVQPNGDRKLVSAMFMTREGVALSDVPDVGGPLTQWHVHDDLCFNGDPVAPRVVGVTTVGGSCSAGQVKFKPTPMIHVWIDPHPCGPFAALEGVAAGQVAPGETHLCNTVHGH